MLCQSNMVSDKSLVQDMLNMETAHLEEADLRHTHMAVA